MTSKDTVARDFAINDREVDIGRPIEWLVDPEDRSVVLGVTYEFNVSGERKTVWYTANKRRPKHFAAVAQLDSVRSP